MTFNGLFLALAAGLFLFTAVDAIKFVRSGRKSMRTRSELRMAIASIAAALNFFSFMVVAVLIGGDALNGRVSAGHYYLGNHGSYTEVSRSVFIYSACHASLAILGLLALFTTQRLLKQ